MRSLLQNWDQSNFSLGSISKPWSTTDSKANVVDDVQECQRLLDVLLAWQAVQRNEKGQKTATESVEEREGHDGGEEEDDEEEGGGGEEEEEDYDEGEQQQEGKKDQVELSKIKRS